MPLFSWSSLKNGGQSSCKAANPLKISCGHREIFQRRAFHGKIWVNYNDLTATSLEIMVRKGNHPQMALIQVSELLYIIYPGK